MHDINTPYNLEIKFYQEYVVVLPSLVGEPSPEYSD
jgi:hypothetical protein